MDGTNITDCSAIRWHSTGWCAPSKRGCSKLTVLENLLVAQHSILKLAF